MRSLEIDNRDQYIFDIAIITLGWVCMTIIPAISIYKLYNAVDSIYQFILIF